ncbi:MAG TPA: hemolysin family protein [Anaerolineales bacterium]|nr:hemolysin family protein [Anaerolineales bacterium]
MSNLAVEILVLLLLLLLNSLFVVSEMAVVSARKARLQQQANEGNKRAATALSLAQNPNTFLSTVQIGITLIGILLGAISGPTFSAPLASLFKQWPLLGPYADSLALGIVVVFITALSLVLGELVPKRVALQNPERIAASISGSMILLSKLFSPLVWLFERLTNFFLQVLGTKPTKEPPVTEEEIQLLIDQGTEAGVFEEAEQDMVEGVFSLSDSRVYSLMTPRTDVVWLDIADSSEEIRRKIAESPFSRFPVCQDSLDTVLGFIKARDLLAPPNLSSDQFKLKEKLRAAIYVPETMLASRALEVFKGKNAEFMFVVDEFGSLQGLLTLNDIIEEIVGDIEVEPQATQRQDGSWLLDGMLEVDNFKEIFKVNALPHEDEYETLSGFVMMSLGRVPQAADHFEWNGLRFEVMDMDGRRVDKVLVTTLPARTSTQTAPAQKVK